MNSYFSEEKFQVLSEYFVDLTNDDLEDFDDDDFFDVVEPKHRALMKVWLKQRNKNALVCPHNITIVTCNKVVDLTEKVVSATHAHLDDSFSLIPIDHIATTIRDKNAVEVLDLTRCGLTEYDIDDIDELTRKLPCLKVLVLRGNKIRTFTDVIRNMAQRFAVDVCFNPIASAEFKWFWEMYNSEDEIFIWISYSYLSSSNRGWRGLVGSEKRAEDVERWHFRFYDQYPNLKLK